MATLYYGSYSLPTYKTLWNPEAFLLSTLGPEVIMILINFLALYKKAQAFAAGIPERADCKGKEGPGCTPAEYPVS